MLISLHKFLYENHVTATGVVHVGAHYGQEYSHYMLCGMKKVIFIEPQRKVFDILKSKFYQVPGVELYNFACGAKPAEKEMFTEAVNQGQSSSLMEPKEHLRQHPEITFNGKERVNIYPLDFINHNDCNVLMIDVQGYELEVLKGATECLKHCDVVYTEVNRDEMYAGCPMVEQIDELLAPLGFKRKITSWASPTLGWGDAIYLKTKQ